MSVRVAATSAGASVGEAWALRASLSGDPSRAKSPPYLIVTSGHITFIHIFIKLVCTYSLIQTFSGTLVTPQKMVI